MDALMLAAQAVLAIVAQDAAALRAAPSAQAAVHAQLAAGDLVELRGQRLDHLQVYDHRRERAGYVRASQLRVVSLGHADAPQLLAVARFLRDAPGSEALGIAYLAAYLRAAPARAVDAEPFDLIGAMAERLARRASNAPTAKAAAASIETVAEYGVRFAGFERDGVQMLCYDGAAFRRVLAEARATPEQRARAALALTRHDCVDPALRPAERAALDRERAEQLEAIGADASAQLPEALKQRLSMRRAGVWAAIAFAQSRRGEAAQAAGQRAIDALAAVNPGQLGDDDARDYTDAAIRVGASRWAAQPAVAPAARLGWRIEPGAQPGQTCVLLADPKRGADVPPLARGCTWGVPWLASARVAADGRSATIAVQLLEGWTELWVLREGRGAWSIDMLPPAAAHAPQLGYIETAGFAPGPTWKLLVAREARVDGVTHRRFEVLSLASLAAERSAASPQSLQAFARWADASWRQGSVSLRQDK